MREEQENNGINQPITPFTQEELDHFREIILTKLKKSEDQLDRMRQRLVNAQEDASSVSAYSLHMADVGTDSMEREKLSLMIAREKKYLGYLQRALDRIENKTYGVCRVTGKPISKERLEAVPHTEISIEAKLKQKSS